MKTLKKKTVIVFHVPFVLGYRASGGGIRPQKMISALREMGEEVIVISGDNTARNAQFRDVLSEISKNRISVKFVYSEAAASPTILMDRRNIFAFRDFLYLRKLKKLGIPIGLFYRDIHWNVSGVFRFSLVKMSLLKTLHFLDLVAYRFFVDVLFLPTERMAPFIPLASLFQRAELPPGHDVLNTVSRENLIDSGLFVGGVLPPVYDMTDIIKASPPFPITVCCRKDEWQQMQSFYGTPAAGVNVVHLQGKELEEEYAKHKYFIMTRGGHQYLRINQPIKLYEAIGHELPILISPDSLAADLVQEWGIGWIVNDLRVDISPEDYLAKRKKLREIKPEHRWISRARSLCKVMEPLALEKE